MLHRAAQNPERSARPPRLVEQSLIDGRAHSHSCHATIIAWLCHDHKRSSGVPGHRAQWQLASGTRRFEGHKVFAARAHGDTSTGAPWSATTRPDVSTGALVRRIRLGRSAAPTSARRRSQSRRRPPSRQRVPRGRLRRTGVRRGAELGSRCLYAGDDFGLERSQHRELFVGKGDEMMFQPVITIQQPLRVRPARLVILDVRRQERRGI